MQIRLKRAYDPPDPRDGYRVLVDRLWPRGLSKKDACVDEWWKACAPTPQLRKWFGHESAKWRDFKQRYRKELDANGDEVSRFIARLKDQRITLIYGAKDTQHNHAIILKEYMESRA